MNAKKSKQANLERRRFQLLLVGLIVAGTLTLTAFEWINMDVNTLYAQEITVDKPQFEPVYVAEQKKEQTIDKREPIKAKKNNTNQKKDTVVPQDLALNPETEEAADDSEVADEAALFDPNAEFGAINHDFGAPDIDLEVDMYGNLDENAEFIGGDRAMYEFLYSKIKYPQQALRLGKEGKIMLEFVVSKTGEITKASILGDPFDQQCAQEALKAVMAMPKWKPGEQFGRKVNVRFRIPVRFEIQ